MALSEIPMQNPETGNAETPFAIFLSFLTSPCFCRHNSITMTGKNNGILTIENYINGSFQAPLNANASADDSSFYLDVTNPSTGAVIARVCRSTKPDVEAAVAAASDAFSHSWGPPNTTIKARAAVLLRFHALVQQHADELADLIVMENGKNKTEVSTSSYVCCAVCVCEM